MMSSRPTPPNPASLHFAAIDFGTADYGRDSACAVAVVRVAGGEIVDRAHFLIRPPRRSLRSATRGVSGQLGDAIH